MSPNCFAQASGLARNYGERAALSEVSFALDAGQTLTVFGPNGAGKSTLLRVLATLLMPHAGEVEVGGHALPKESYLARPLIGMLGHDALLYRDLSGRENLRFYASLYDIPNPDERIEELLDVCAMSHRADEPLRDLSRGMIQRLAVCRAVLHEPELLLLDEPHSGLDPEAERLVEPLIGHGCGATRIVVTHDIERGLLEADQVLGLRDGRVALAQQPKLGTKVEQIRALYEGSHP